MAGYVIVDITVTDPAGFAEYQKVAGPIVAKYGGRLLSPPGRLSPHWRATGDWHPKGITVIECSSVERAKQWHAASEYQEPKRHMLLVDGLSVPVARGTKHR